VLPPSCLPWKASDSSIIARDLLVYRYRVSRQKGGSAINLIATLATAIPARG